MRWWPATATIMGLVLGGCDPIGDVCHSCIGNDPNAVLNPAQQAKVGLIGTPRRLPPSAQDVRYHEECGIDCVQWLRFEAPLDDARAFANRLLVRPIAVGAPVPLPGGAADRLDWWPSSLPAQAESGANETLTPGYPLLFVAVLPQGDRARVWLRAFNT